MSINKKADRKTESKAKKLFQYKTFTPEQFSVFGTPVISQENALIDLEYSDTEFNTWMKTLRNCLNDPDTVSSVLEQYVVADEDDDWRLNIEELSRYFEGFELPKSLSKLVEYQNAIESYVTSFYVTSDGASDLECWSDHDLSPYFKVFGGFSDGARYAFWIRESGLSNAPIIYLGGEGSAEVIAKDFDDFLHLIACGDAAIGRYDEDEEPIDIPNNSVYSESKSIKNYKSWLQRELAVKNFKDRAQIESEVILINKEFSQWAKSYEIEVKDMQEN